MTTPNPLQDTHSKGSPSHVSSKTYSIAGILTTVYGLDELPANVSSVACLWLLHPRLSNQERMAPIAARTISAWNSDSAQRQKGLIAVSFDQRNHGTRQVDPLSNEAWRNGNPCHAQDMFSIYHGTATDTSHLLHYLPAYLPCPAPTTHLALGVSLGGHAVWHTLLHDLRITAGVIVIGCPDYTALMQQRARLSKLSSWTSTDPPGVDFIGSSDFPPALVDAVAKWDPSGLLMRGVANPEALTEAETKNLASQMKSTLAGKRILSMSGGADKLVPYSCGEPFLRFLKRAVAENGNVLLEDIVFEGVGHEMTAGMAEQAVRFVCETLAGEGGNSGVRESKI